VILIPPNEVQRVLEDGRTFIASGKYDEAVQCFDWVLEQEPNNGEAWNGKGSALTGSEKFEDAIACFDMALQLNPDLAFAWRNKGKALDRLGRDGEAQECYGKAEVIANRMMASREAADPDEDKPPPKKRFSLWK
jgi:Flp pilus assembly protein TadD